VKPVPGLDGDYIFREGQVVTKLSRTETSDIYCSGIQVINPQSVNDLTEDRGSFYQVWSQLIAREKLIVSSVYPKQWFAVDTIDQLVTLNGRWAQGVPCPSACS
jgi:NDP-sugar pyrophosphorylase family protein